MRHGKPKPPPQDPLGGYEYHCGGCITSFFIESCRIRDSCKGIPAAANSCANGLYSATSCSFDTQQAQLDSVERLESSIERHEFMVE